MVRNWIFILIAILVTVAFSGMVLSQSAASPIIEEPWVYGEMEALFREGLISDYPSEWVASGNKLTRFEVAYYIKTIITNELDSPIGKAKMNLIPQPMVESIRRLVVEFRPELTAMGVEITDIYTISPNLDETMIKNDDYQDLDIILSRINDTTKDQESYYYFGQYIQEIYRKSFLFLPSIFVQDDNRALLQGTVGTINIVHHPNQKDNPPFLVVKGDLTLNNEKSIKGYYLFPLDNPAQDTVVKETSNLNASVLDLLDEVNHVRQVESLWRFNGPMPLKGYSNFKPDFQSKLVVEEVNNSLKIGGFLVTTEDKPDLLNMGLPFYSSRQPAAVDLDSINRSNLQSFQINIQGNMSLNDRTSITGELGLLYRNDKNGWNEIWPSDTKAGAGIEYQFNNYWSVLSYQSFVNSQLESGMLSTTSLGLEYNNWATLWLAYQIISFDDSRLTGALTFRF
ncbi:MAG: hypothetical protein ACM3YE_16140 [Bacteroidota bacterium]